MDRFNQMQAATQTARGRKVFSVRQANRALVLVRPIVTNIVDEYAKVLEIQEMLELAQRHGSVQYINRLQSDMAASVSRIQGYLDELDQVRVELRDLARGLVDFPSRMDGREVCLCWQLGEPGVSYWYERGSSLAARRPVAELVETPQK
jgi:hypothetical protein